MLLLCGGEADQGSWADCSVPGNALDLSQRLQASQLGSLAV